MVTSTTIALPAFEPPAVSNEEQDDRIQKLRATHPDWELFNPQWNFFLSAYEGGQAFCTSENIFRHARENQQDYDDRLKRAHNMNYCEPLVDFFTNFIFSESIDRDGGKSRDFYQTFIKNVNKKGDSVDDFMRQVCDDMQIFGLSYVLVDTPSINTEFSKLDEEKNGVRPYWVLVKPGEIIDWIVDEFDAFKYAKRKQINTVLIGEERKTFEVYTEFYEVGYRISRIDITDPAKPEWYDETVVGNSLGRIPLVVGRYKRSKNLSHMGLSFLRDFAYNNREITNLTSLLQEFLYRQAFNILAKEVDSSLPPAQQTEGEIGTANALDVPKGAQFPQYISPPVDPAEFLQEERARIKNEMFVRAAQDALNELFNGEKASGFSQAQSFSKTVPFISSRADMLERVENELMELTMSLVSKEWDGKIKYKDNYAITNLTDALTQFQMLARDLQIPSETFVKKELIRLVHEFDGKLPADVLTKIQKEIEDMSFDTWAETQKEALVGKGSSPGDQQKPKSTGTMAEAAAEAKTNNTAGTKKLRKAPSKAA
jgi:hypothetical protein